MGCRNALITHEKSVLKVLLSRCAKLRKYNFTRSSFFSKATCSRIVPIQSHKSVQVYILNACETERASYSVILLAVYIVCSAQTPRCSAKIYIVLFGKLDLGRAFCLFQLENKPDVSIYKSTNVVERTQNLADRIKTLQHRQRMLLSCINAAF